MCTDGVPSQIDACKCGSFDGPECKKGDVCVDNQCYGADSAAVGGYCEYGKLCSNTCACSDAAFTTAGLCDRAQFYCDGGVIRVICAQTDLISNSCKCAPTDAANCAAQSVCFDSQCVASSGIGNICTANVPCTSSCSCYKDGAKKALTCENSSQFCKDGVLKTLCTDKTVNESACSCEITDAAECAKNNVCIDSKCFGAAAENGDFCSGTSACVTACACKANDGTTAEKCAGQYNYCEDGSVVVKCPKGYKQDGQTCKKSGLGIGAIVGIVIAVLIVLIAVCVGIFFFLKHKKQEKKPEYQEEKEENEVQVAAE